MQNVSTDQERMHERPWDRYSINSWELHQLSESLFPNFPSNFCVSGFFSEVTHACKKTPEEQLPGAISSSTNSVKRRRHHFFSSPPTPLRNLLVPFLLQKHLQLLPMLSGCFCSCQSLYVTLKSECSSVSKQVAICPLVLLKTKNPSRGRDSALNVRLPQKSCAKGNLCSDVSRGWHNYLSAGS